MNGTRLMFLDIVIPVLLSLVVGAMCYTGFKYQAGKKFDPDGIEQSYWNLRDLHQTSFPVIVVVPSVAAIITLITYAKWTTPEFLLEGGDLSFYLVVFWCAAPIFTSAIGTHVAIIPYWRRLFDQDLSFSRTLCRRIAVFLVWIIAAGICLVFVHFFSQSVVQYSIGLGILFSLPIFQSVGWSRVLDWWSLRRQSIERTPYAFSNDISEAISEYNLTVEKSFEEGDTNAYAEGISPLAPTIRVCEGVFRNLSEPARKATIYHEICHHENDDQLKQAVVSGVSFVVAAIVATVVLKVIQSNFGRINDWVVLAVIAISIVGVGMIHNILAGMLSRKAEYLADEYAASKVGSEAMIEALDEDLDQSNRGLVSRWMDTHPPREKRVKNLRNE